MTTVSSVNFTTASIGKKILMAVTGVILLGFILVHLIGNLQIFIGQEQLNKYAETLQSMGALKWGFRIFLFLFVAVHIWKGVVLWLENRGARPISYKREETIQASISSRTMIYTGALIILFVGYHLLHFTLIATNPEYAQLPPDPAGRFDVYSMVILGFSNYLISGVYIAAMFLLAFHLSHAISSLFQTLGLNNPTTMPILKLIANLCAVVFFVGYVSIPVAVLLNIVKLPGGGH